MDRMQPSVTHSTVLHPGRYLVVGGGLEDVGDIGCRAIGVSGRKVGQDLCSIEALPPERGVRKLVVQGPGELLGEKELHASPSDELWQLGTVAGGGSGAKSQQSVMMISSK